MIIQYASDLHIEFAKNSLYLVDNPIKPFGDILILAGDIGYWDKRMFEHKFFDYLSRNFKQVYYLPGNHEFYAGKDIKVLRKPVCESIRKNVHLVSNVVVNIGDTDFIFTPLWSNITHDKVMVIQEGIADFNKIKYRGKSYNVFDHNNFHQRSLNFLEKALSASDAKNKVVITHFVPSRLCNSEEYKTSQINDYFVNELYDFIEASNIDYWIYGHHHYNCETVKIGNTQLVTNQLGYVNRNEHNCFQNVAYFVVQTPVTVVH